MKRAPRQAKWPRGRNLGSPTISVIALFVLLAIAFETPQPSPFQLMMYRSCLALATAGIVAMIPGFLNLQLGTLVQTRGALCIFLVVYFCNPAQLSLESSEQKSVFFNGPAKIVHVAVLMNGVANYVQNSRSTLQQTLETEFPKKGFQLHIEEEVGCPSEEGIDKNQAAIEKLLARFPGNRPDYFVTIGTAVSQHAKKLLAGKQIPMVFIGVTNPIAAGLVSSLNGDSTRGTIAGTTYPPSPVDLMQKLQQYFPGERLGFIYSRRYPQDVAMKNDIEAISKSSGVNVSFIETDQVNLTEAQMQSATVFFGKYMLCSNLEAFAHTYPGLKFIGASASNASKGALATIGPDDSELGRLAALQIIIPNLVDGESLAAMKIIQPAVHVIVNVTTARRLDANVTNLLSDQNVKQLA